MIAKTKNAVRSISNQLLQKKKYLHLENWTKTQVMKLLRFLLALVCLFAPILIFYLTESIVHVPTEDMNSNALTLNILLYEIIFLILLGVTGSLRFALILETVVFTTFALANYYVISFRSAPIQPWDIYSLRTAASVSSDFHYNLPITVIWKLLVLIALVIIFAFLNYKMSIKKFWILRLLITLIGLSCFSNFTTQIHDDRFIAKMKLYDKLFTPTTIYYRDGGAVAFLMECKYLSVDCPDDYSVSYANSLLHSDSTETPLAEAPTVKKQPNIIVIMSEAFSDPAVLGDFNTNEDYMPFVHSLSTSDKASTGYLNVSIVGGNTANSEFEFLTGNTMAFLPAGSVAYQQFIHSKIDCLPNYLKDLGYNTYAAHPFNATGWCRDKVYEYMNFDEMYFRPDFKDPLKIRSYVSDFSCNDKIIETYENNLKTGNPFFMFLVTMQNHSSYTKEYPNFTPNIEVDGSDSFALSGYLSLLQKSDQALQELTEYFSKVEEETIIVFFGDHQPSDSVVKDIYKVSGQSTSKLTEEEKTLRYKVPYIIWNNFDAEVSHDVETSANYLAVKALQTANLPLSPYMSFLDEEQKLYPVLSTQKILKADGTFSSLKQEKEGLSDYQILQYYQLFDAK